MPPASARMPPFAGLLAFEAVLRHGSMTLAGDELGLTQSAVSHRIRALEEFFGVPLLERLNPGLRVTDAGARLAREIGPLLGTLGGMRRRIGGPSGPRIFRLGLSSPLLAWWLSPRLPALCSAFPDLSIEIVTWDTAAEAAKAEVDLALLWVRQEGSVEGACERMFPIEGVFPVAAPELVGSNRRSRNWQTLPLLAKGLRGEETGREWSWATWLQGGGPGPERIRFRDIGGSLQAAADGNGVALARSLLASDALLRGRLVRLAAPDEARPSSKIQVARWRDPKDLTAECLAESLASAAAQTLASTTGLTATADASDSCYRATRHR